MCQGRGVRDGRISVTDNKKRGLMAHTQEYDLAIIGKGVTGAAAGFIQNYGNCRLIAHIERQRGAGLVNSNVSNNSQTLHEGGIETNYGLRAALRVREGAGLVKGFIDTFLPEGAENQSKSSLTLNKMVIGVGEAEVAKL